MALCSVSIPTGGERSFTAIVWKGAIFAVTKSLAPALSLSEGGLRGVCSRLELSSSPNDALKEALSLKGKIRFLNSGQIESLLRHRLEGDALATALHALHQIVDHDQNQHNSECLAESDVHPLDDREGGLEDVAVRDEPGEDDEDAGVLALAELAIAQDKAQLLLEPVEFPLCDGGSSNSLEPPAVLVDSGNDDGKRTLHSLPSRNRFLNLHIPDELRGSVAEAALDMADRFSESVQRKMSLVARVWTEVCAARGWDAKQRNVSDETLLEFTWLCLHKDYGIQYSLYTWRDTYLPTLFRYFDKEGITYSDDIRDRLKQKIKAMVRNGDLSPEQIPKERGAEPICTWDLEHIASVYPKGCRDRAQVMSWMSVGLHTGVRGVSLESAMWEDVRVVEPVAEMPHFKQVTLVFLKTKGDDNWHHAVTIEGSTLNASGSDPVYWLSQLVKQRLGPNVELTQSVVSTLTGQVLAAADDSPVAKETMSVRLEAIGRYSGYPANMLSNHGLRSGFLCVSLLKQSMDPRDEVNISDVWTKCALVAGWTVNSCHMTGYCKQAFLRCIVSSRLIRGGTLQPDTEDVVVNLAGVGAVAKNRLTPLAFHGLTELVPCWPESTQVQLWVDHFGDCIHDVICQRRPDLVGRAAVNAERYVANQSYLQMAVLNGLGRDVSVDESHGVAF